MKKYLSVLFGLFMLFSTPAYAEEDMSGDTTFVNKLLEIARIHGKENRFDSALAYGNQAIEISKEINFWEGLVMGENLLGRSLHFMSRFEESLSHHQKSLEIAQKYLPENHPELSACYRGLGECYLSLGDFNQSAKRFESALKVARVHATETESEVMLECLKRLSFCASSNGQVEEALEYLKEAINVVKADTGDTRKDRAEVCSAMGNVLLGKGDYMGSIAQYQEALDISYQVFDGEDEAIGALLKDQGEAYDALGNHEKAHILLNKALNIMLKAYGENHMQVASTLSSLGVNAYSRRKYQKAIELDYQALEIIKLNFGPGSMWAGLTYRNMVASYSELRDYEKALDVLKKAEEIFLNIAQGEDSPQLLVLYANKAALYLEMDETDKAQENIARATELGLRFIGERHPFMSRIFNSSGAITKTRGELEKSLKFYQKAVIASCISFSDLGRYALPDRDDIAALKPLISSLTEKGEVFLSLYQKNKNPEDLLGAKKTYDFVLKIIEEARISFAHEKSQLDLLESTNPTIAGALKGSWILYQEFPNMENLEYAFQLMEKSKSLLLTQALRKNHAIKYAGVPEEMVKKGQALKVDLAYYRQKLVEEQLKGEEIAATPIEQLRGKLFELERAFQDYLTEMKVQYPEYINFVYQQKFPALTEIQDALPGDSTAVIEYYYQGGACYVMTITKAKVRFQKLEVEEKLEGQVIHFLDQLKNGTLAENQGQSKRLLALFAKESHLLYQQILEPALPSPDSLNELIVISDGVLGYLPFDLLLTKDVAGPELPDGYKDLPYLLRSYQIRYEYSAALLLNIQKKKEGNSNHYLGFAPEYPPSGGNISPSKWAMLREGNLVLENNQPEVEEVAEILGGRKFLGSQATLENFKKYATDYRCLHLAMHAFVNDSMPAYSGLLFSPGDSALDRATLNAYELYNMKLNADLAVLSACNTGAGKLQRGEGVMSLARAFKYAGCPSVVMSLWQADDQAVREIVTSFFKHVDSGMEKDKALKMAKLEYLESSPKNHPFFWGAFVLIGNDRPLPSQSLIGGGGKMILWGLLALGIVLLGFSYWKKRYA